MIEKKIVNGKTVTNIDNLQEWDKNPRFIEEKDFSRLKRQIENLGLYKPFLVTELGIVIGGNMRLRACRDLVSEGKLPNDVPITELSFAEEERPADATPEWKPRFKAVIDGKLQDRWFNSIDQMMVEYALSDNDAAGRYDTQALAELIQPVKQDIPQEDYKLELGYPVSMETFLSDLAGDKQETNAGGEDDVDQNKSKVNVLGIKFTPEQFKTVEPRVENAKVSLGLENDTDLFMKLLDIYEALYPLSISNSTITLQEAMKPFWVDTNDTL